MINSANLPTIFNYQSGLLIWRYNPNKSPQWNGKHEGQIAGAVRSDGRRVIRLDRKLYLASRLIYAYHYGNFPPEVDHINRDASDDRVENLRASDRKLNNQNVSAKGYIRRGNKYLAKIYRNGTSTHLGTFATKEEAHKAYSNARRELDGELYD